MRLRINSKDELTADGAQAVSAALATDSPSSDFMLRSWTIYQAHTLFAFLSLATGDPVGVAEASGPPDAANPSWWIAPRYRGQLYGRDLACLLTQRLKLAGYTKVSQKVAIDSRQAEASAAILARFRRCFEGYACN